MSFEHVPRELNRGPDRLANRGVDEWLAGAEKQSGSWWEAWADWNVARSGRLVARPEILGNATRPVLEDAPGSYVRDQVPE